MILILYKLYLKRLLFFFFKTQYNILCNVKYQFILIWALISPVDGFPSLWIIYKNYTNLQENSKFKTTKT